MWSSEGRYLAFCTTGNRGTLKVMDTTTHAILENSQAMSPQSLSWSPDGQMLASGGAVSLWSWSGIGA